MLSGVSDNLLKLEYHAGFNKIEQWIMKNRQACNQDGGEAAPGKIFPLLKNVLDIL